MIREGHKKAPEGRGFSALRNNLRLEAELDGKLELTSIVGSCRLAGGARSLRRVAKLIHRGNVGVVKQVETVCDQI